MPGLSVHTHTRHDPPGAVVRACADGLQGRVAAHLQGPCTMTQLQLERSIARSTGDSLRTVRRLGFGPGVGSLDLEPEDLRLAVDCPFCGRPCALPADRFGTTPMAECETCDIDFDYRPHEVYTVSVEAGLTTSAA